MKVTMKRGSPIYKNVNRITDISYGTMILRWNDGCEVELHIGEVDKIEGA